MFDGKVGGGRSTSTATYIFSISTRHGVDRCSPFFTAMNVSLASCLVRAARSTGKRLVRDNVLVDFFC